MIPVVIASAAGVGLGFILPAWATVVGGFVVWALAALAARRLREHLEMGAGFRAFAEQAANPHPCLACHRSFKTEDALTQHMLANHIRGPMEPEDRALAQSMLASYRAPTADEPREVESLEGGLWRSATWPSWPS